MENEIIVKEVESRVIELRGQQVLLDVDVAELYQVGTKQINQAVKRNPDKFPEKYCFTLQMSEKQYVVTNCDHLEPLKYSPVVPKAFTERGLYMLATVLKSPRATATTIAIIEAFTKLRETSRRATAQETPGAGYVTHQELTGVLNNMLELQKQQLELVNTLCSAHTAHRSDDRLLCEETTNLIPDAPAYREKVYALCDQIARIHGRLDSRHAVLTHIFGLMSFPEAIPYTNGIDWEEEKASFKMDTGYTVVSRLGMVANREEGHPLRNYLISSLNTFLQTIQAWTKQYKD